MLENSPCWYKNSKRISGRGTTPFIWRPPPTPQPPRCLFRSTCSCLPPTPSPKLKSSPRPWHRPNIFNFIRLKRQQESKKKTTTTDRQIDRQLWQLSEPSQQQWPTHQSLNTVSHFKQSSSRLAIIEIAPHTTLSQLFTNFVRKLRLRFRIRSETDLTSNIARHCCIMSVELVLNNFINSLVWTKSSDRLSATLSGQTSRPYNNIGIHLVAIRCRTVSSVAIWRTLPNFAMYHYT